MTVLRMRSTAALRHQSQKWLRRTKVATGLDVKIKSTQEWSWALSSDLIWFEPLVMTRAV